MIVDVTYKNDTTSKMVVSYINKEGTIDIMNFDVSQRPNQFTNWVYADDINKPIDGYISYDGKHVSLVYNEQFNKFDFVQFIQSLPDDVKSTLLDFNKVDVYAFDIETEIIDEFPDAENAKTPIVSIAITACDSPTLKTIVFTTDYDRINEKVTKEIEDISQTYISENYNANQQIDVSVISCKNEYELLKRFLDVFKKIPAMIAWNSDNYDWPYVKKRLAKNGLSMSESSVDGTLDRNGLPSHKIIKDYMDMFKSFEYSLRPYESFSLNYVANKSLKLPKLSYDGTLKDLREKDIARFLAYNVIDTAILGLLHKKHNLFNVLYGLALVTSISIRECTGPVNQSESVLFKYYLSQTDNNGNKIICPAHEPIEKRNYEGGFVKNPVKHFINYVACFDYSSLYPSIMRTHNISPTNFLRKITDDEKSQYASNPDFFISSQNSLYDNRFDTAYKIIESELYVKRKSYQGDENFYRNLAFDILKEKQRRGLIDTI